MSTDTTAISNQRPAIEFKSSSFAVPALLINSIDLKEINQKVLEKIQQAPEFFNNSPILLDIQALSKQKLDINIASLIKQIRDHKLIPIALKGGNEQDNQTALKNGLFIQPVHTTTDNDKALPNISPADAKAKDAVAEDPSVASALHSPIRNERRNSKYAAGISKIMTTPIRSGQRVYSEGDLVIMSQVSAGAEIMAEGNIHVYGSLRGRALAGVLGNADSRIFCFDCQAELIAIAGNYKVNDDLDQSIKHKPVQIYLQEHALIIKEL